MIRRCTAGLFLGLVLIGCRTPVDDFCRPSGCYQYPIQIVYGPGTTETPTTAFAVADGDRVDAGACDPMLSACALFFDDIPGNDGSRERDGFPWLPYATLRMTVHLVTRDGTEIEVPIEVEVDGCGRLGRWTYRITLTGGEPLVVLESTRPAC